MRVAVMTAGSLGDVAPYTGLGHGLARAGHEVTLVTHARFGPLAQAAGLGFHALPVDPHEELRSAAGQGLHRSTTGAGKLVRLVAMARALVGRMTGDLLAAAERSDVLLVSGSLAPVGQVLADGLGLPFLGVPLQPLTPTAAFAPPVLGARSWGPAGNRLAGHAVDAAVDMVHADVSRALRRRFGLHRRGGAGRDRPVHHGFSPLVVPRPRDWRPGLHIGGYWWPYVAPDTRLPDAVRDFVAAGRPPVYVGLGSATVPDPARVSATVVASLRAAGLRGVIQRGWSGLTAAGDDMLVVDDVPHSLLFPHMAAVVHHAGAGTTAAGLRAGVPAVPVPIQFDGAFWAARLTALGLAPAPLPLRHLTPDALAAALRAAVHTPAFARRARDLAARLRTEDGVAPVAEALDRLPAGRPR